jgi:hypothetical protein
MACCSLSPDRSSFSVLPAGVRLETNIKRTVLLIIFIRCPRSDSADSMHGMGMMGGGFGFYPYFRIIPIVSTYWPTFDKSLLALPQEEAESVQNKEIDESLFDKFGDIAHDKYCKWADALGYPSEMNLFRLGAVERVPILKAKIFLNSSLIDASRDGINGQIDATVKDGSIGCTIDKAIFKVSMNSALCGTIDYNAKTITVGSQNFRFDRHDTGIGELDPTKSVDITLGEDTVCTINIEQDPMRVFTNVASDLAKEAKAVIAVMYVFEEAISISCKFHDYADASQEALSGEA